MFPTWRKEEHSWLVHSMGCRCVWQEASEDQAQPELWEALSQDKWLQVSCFKSRCCIIAARRPSLTPPFPLEDQQTYSPLSWASRITLYPVLRAILHSLCSSGPCLRPLHWVLLGPRAGLLGPLSALVQACHIVGAEESLVWLHEAGPLVSGRGGTGVLGKGRQG